MQQNKSELVLRRFPHFVCAKAAVGMNRGERVVNYRARGRTRGGRDGEADFAHVFWSQCAPIVAAVRIILADRTTLVNNMAKKQPR